jgi:hypothetical protein
MTTPSGPGLGEAGMTSCWQSPKRRWGRSARSNEERRLSKEERRLTDLAIEKATQRLKELADEQAVCPIQGDAERGDAPCLT